MEVLCLGYCIPFHQLLPVAGGPIEFPSYSLCQGELDKMLEEVEYLSSIYYSRLFMVQKVSGRWRPVVDLSSLNSYVTLTPFKMEIVSLVLRSIRKGM